MHEDAAYTWLRQAGLSMQRATPRMYTDAEKAEFFRLVRSARTSLRSRESSGSPGSPATAWARKAGIFTSEARKVNPRREEFLRLRARGPDPRRGRGACGADNRSATDWDKGITIINRGRIYPDGRVVRYPEPDTRTRRDTTTQPLGPSAAASI